MRERVDMADNTDTTRPGETDKSDLYRLAGDAAALEFRREQRKDYADTNAFRVAFYILRDADAAGRIVDRLWDEYRVEQTVEVLPQRAPHGTYRFHNGEWKMAAEECRIPGHPTGWHAQDPHAPNERYFRDEVARTVTAVAAAR